MTYIASQPVPDRPVTLSQQELLRRALRRGRANVLSLIVSVLAAAPIGLLADPTTRPYGVAWVILYGAFMIPSAGAYFYLMIDSVLVIMGARPLVLDQIIVAAAHGEPALPARRMYRIIHRLAQASAFANPLAQFAITALHLAVVVRRDFFTRTLAAGRTPGSAPFPVLTVPRDMQVEWAEPVVDQVIEEQRYAIV